MQSLSFDQDRPTYSQNKFLRVKTKGDAIKFRLAGNPVYTGKHFTQTENGWNVTDCPRVNLGEKCELCEKFFSIKADQKKAKEAGDAANEKLLANEARKVAASVSYYFPVLLRKTTLPDWQNKVGKFVILQTTEGVRNKIKEQYETEVKIFQRDFVLKNTGSETPRDIYALSVVDSSDTVELTEEEKDEYKKAQEFDMSTVNDGSSNTDEIGDVEIEDDDEASPEVAEKIFNETDVKEEIEIPF